MKEKLVSIVIPCFNGENTIVRALDSIKNQNYNNIEVLVMDDGSTDRTSTIVNEYMHKNNNENFVVKYFYQENAGQASAVNKLLKECKGYYFMWQDCDDYYEQDAINKMVIFLEKNKQFNFIRGKANIRYYKKIEKVIRVAESKFPKNTNIFDSYVFETDSYMFVGIFFTTMEFLDKCLVNREIYTSRAGQNWQLILPMAYYGKCGYLDEVVYNYIIYDNSHSHIHRNIKESFKRINDFKDILFNVFDKIPDFKGIQKQKYKMKVRIKYLKIRIKLVIKFILRIK